MPRVGLYKRRFVKEVMPSVRVSGGATAANFGAAEAAGMMQGAEALQDAGRDMMQNAIREKRKEELEQEKQKREAEAAAKKAEYEAEKAEVLRAESTGRDASNAFQKELRNLEREWSGLKGRNAVGAYKSYSSKTDELYSKYSQGLSEKELKSFNYYSGHRYNSSLDSLSKFDLASQKNFEVQTLSESISGKTDDLVNSRYNFDSVDDYANKITEDVNEIALRNGLDENGTKNLIKTSLHAAHTSAINAMLEDGKYDEALQYLEKFEGDMVKEKLPGIKNDISDRRDMALAPQYAKDILNKYPGDLVAQARAIDEIGDPKLRELARKEWTVQREIATAGEKRKQQEMFENVLGVALVNVDGSIPATWNRRPVPLDIIDKVREARDRIISNRTGNIEYYYDIKEQLELGRIKELDFNTVALGQLTSEQIQDLYKTKNEVNNKPAGSISQKYVATFNEQCNTEIDAANPDFDSQSRARIRSKARTIFETLKAQGNEPDYKQRDEIIRGIINEYTPGEETEGFVNTNMTLGEAKKQGYSDVFQPDRATGVYSDAKWSSDIEAWIRPDNSELGVTLQDAFGSDITPVGLEAGTKWNSDLNSFIRKDKNRLYITDKTGRPIFDVSKKAKYIRDLRRYGIAGGGFVDLVEQDNGDFIEQKEVIYSLRDGSAIELSTE